MLGQEVVAEAEDPRPEVSFFLPGLDRQIAFSIEPHRAVIEVRRADPQQPVIHDQHLGVDVDWLAPLGHGRVEAEPAVNIGLFDQPERSYTWWDYRNLAFRRKMGLRIDHILVSGELATRCSGCVIDVEPRRREQPSDHAPVVVTLD